MKTAYIAPDVLLRFMMGNDLDELRGMITSPYVRPITSSFAFYEALSCLSAIELARNAAIIEYVLASIPITGLEKIMGEKHYSTPKKRKDKLRHIATTKRHMEDAVHHNDKN